MSSNYHQQKFIMDPNASQELSCEIVLNFEYSNRCAFVRDVHDCQYKISIGNYMNLFFCTFEPKSGFMYFVYVICFLVFCFFLFLTLGLIVDMTLVPSIKVICRICHINEHLAGATVLSFGSSAPDALYTIGSIIKQDDQHGLFANIFASNLYRTIFIGGVIIVLTPFKMHHTNALRDAAFVLFAILYIDYAIRTDECLSTLECICILGVYIMYFSVLVIDQILLHKLVKNTNPDQLPSVLDSLSDESIFDVKERSQSLTNKNRLSIADVDRNRLSMFNPMDGKNNDLFRQFIESLNPLDWKTFHVASKLKKGLFLVRTPLKLMILIALPIVDYASPRHGWSKLLNCIQTVLLLPLILFSIWDTKTLYGYQIWPMSFLATVPVAIYLFMFTRTDVPPKGHFVLAFLSVAGSMVGLYICATEIMEMFNVIGIVLNCSGDFLSVTVMCWGMSLGDLYGNISIALSGYERMGYAACYGAAMFSTIFIVGFNYLYKTVSGNNFCHLVRLKLSQTIDFLYYDSLVGIFVCMKMDTYRTPTDENCICFTFLGLIFTIVSMLLLNGQARRCLGFFSIGLYVFFFIYMLLSELSILHSYSNDLLFFPID